MQTVALSTIVSLGGFQLSNLISDYHAMVVFFISSQIFMIRITVLLWLKKHRIAGRQYLSNIPVEHVTVEVDSPFE